MQLSHQIQLGIYFISGPNHLIDQVTGSLKLLWKYPLLVLNLTSQSSQQRWTHVRWDEYGGLRTQKISVQLTEIYFRNKISLYKKERKSQHNSLPSILHTCSKTNYNSVSVKGLQKTMWQIQFVKSSVLGFELWLQSSFIMAESGTYFTSCCWRFEVVLLFPSSLSLRTCWEYCFQNRFSYCLRYSAISLPWRNFHLHTISEIKTHRGFWSTVWLVAICFCLVCFLPVGFRSTTTNFLRYWIITGLIQLKCVLLSTCNYILYLFIWMLTIDGGIILPLWCWHKVANRSTELYCDYFTSWQNCHTYCISFCELFNLILFSICSSPLLSFVSLIWNSHY